MANRVIDLIKNKKYKWEFENIGGTSRVCITKGEDIKHLDELDIKMWTVLSCPVNGLEIEDKSLSYIDSDADGKIRVQDILTTAQWITGVIKDADLLLAKSDSFDIDNIINHVEKYIENDLFDDNVKINLHTALEIYN